MNTLGEQRARGCDLRAWLTSEPGTAEPQRADDRPIWSLIDILYEAAENPARWTEALRQICDVFHSPAMTIQSVDHRAGTGSFFVSYGIPENALTEYNDHVLQRDPRLRFAAQHPNLRVTHDELHTSSPQLHAKDYYAWLQRAGGLSYYIGATLCRSEARSVYATLYRRHDSVQVDAATLGRFTQLVPHLARAGRLSQSIANLRELASSTVHLVDRLSFGFFLLDAAGLIIYCNRTAEALLAARDGLYLSASRLHAFKRTDDASLRKLIAGAIAMEEKTGDQAQLSMVLPRPSGRQPYTIVVASVASREPPFATETPAAAVLVSDPQRHQPVPEDVLQDLYGLTRTEAALSSLPACTSAMS